MPEFLVRWEIEVIADDALGAARTAHNIQLDPKSTATVYEVLNLTDAPNPAIANWESIDLATDDPKQEK
jgi:hypothetical protein